MATGYFDFESDTVGAAPTGLTAMLNTTTSTWTVQNDGAGGKCLRLAKTGTSDAGMSIDAIGNTTGSVELYALMRSGSTNGTQTGLGTLMTTDTASSTSAYNYLVAALVGGTDLASIRQVATVNTSWSAYYDIIWTANTLYHVRFRLVVGTDDAYARIWVDGAAEPEAWTNVNEASPMSGLTTGHAGPFARDVNGPQEWLFIGWATDGDAAPTSATGGTTQLATPTNFTFTAHASLRQLNGEWTAVANAGSYEASVDYETDPDVWVNLTTYSGTATSFQLTDANGVAWATTYRARVRALPAV